MLINHSISVLLSVLGLWQETTPGVVLGPSPPPNRFDALHDEQLFGAWGGKREDFVGPFDSQRAVQPAPIRPKKWDLFEGGTQYEDGLPLIKLITSETEADRNEPNSSAYMPITGELRGAFVTARTQVVAENEEVRFVRAPGVTKVFVNGVGFIGDPERRKWLGVPVPLRKGVNTIWAVGIRGGFELEFWKPTSRIVVTTWAIEATGDWFVEAPFFNASTLTTKIVHAHYGAPNDPQRGVPSVHEWADRGEIASLGMSTSRIFVVDLNVILTEEQWKRAVVPIVTWADDDSNAQRILFPVSALVEKPARTLRNKRESNPYLDRKPLLFIYDTTRTPEEVKASLEVARFCQQELWYREGKIATLRGIDPETWKSDDLWEIISGPVVKFGISDEMREAPGTLIVDLSRFGSDKNFPATIEGSDPAGLRLAYAVSPLFQNLANSTRRWN